MPEPIVGLPASLDSSLSTGFSGVGATFVIREWRGSGPATPHVHHADDEAWHVLEGTLHFRFIDREVDVRAGGTVFVPAGVSHTYEARNARYLVVLTPRLDALIAELQAAKTADALPAIYQKYASTLLE